MPFDDLEPDMAFAAGRSPVKTGGSDWQSLFDELSGDLETRYGFKREYAQRQLRKESGGNRKARSFKGATGLMQLMPGTAARYGVKDSTDPIQNIRGWHGYMNDLLKMFGGDSKKALAAYNAGEGAVQKHGYERVRGFSNLPKGDPRRGSYTGSTGEYVDKITGELEQELQNINQTQPVRVKKRPRQDADMEFAAQFSRSAPKTPQAPKAQPNVPTIDDVETVDYGNAVPLQDEALYKDAERQAKQRMVSEGPATLFRPRFLGGRSLDERTQEIYGELKQKQARGNAGQLPTLGLTDKLADIAQRPGQLIPFNTVELEELAGVKAAADRLEAGTATPSDEIILKDFVARSKQDTNFKHKVASTIAMLPAFAGELALTGGVFSAGRQAARAGITKLASEAGLAAIEKRLAGRLAVKGVESLAGAALQTVPASVTRIPTGTLDRQLQGQSFGQALRNTMADQFIEIASERTGGALAHIPVPKRLAAIQRAVTNRWLTANPDQGLAGLKKLVDRVGWHGVLGEMFEERVGDVARYGIGQQESPVPTLEQLAVEGISFSVPGAAVSLAARAKKSPTLAPITPSGGNIGYHGDTQEQADMRFAKEQHLTKAAELAKRRAALTKKGTPIPEGQITKRPLSDFDGLTDNIDSSDFLIKNGEKLSVKEVAARVAKTHPKDYDAFTAEIERLELEGWTRIKGGPRAVEKSPSMDWMDVSPEEEARIKAQVEQEGPQGEKPLHPILEGEKPGEIKEQSSGLKRAPEIHTIEDLRTIASGTGRVKLYHGGPRAILEKLAAKEKPLFKTAREAAELVAKAYGIPVYEFLNKTHAGSTVSSYEGSRVDKLSTAPPPIARRWKGFPLGEILSDLDGTARLYLEAKRQGLSLDEFYDSLPPGDSYKNADKLGLPSKFEHLKSEGNALAEIEVDARSIPEMQRERAARLLKALDEGRTTEEEVLNHWNTAFRDIKIAQQNLGNIEVKEQPIRDISDRAGELHNTQLKEYLNFLHDNPARTQGMGTISEASLKNYLRIMGEAVETFRPDLQDMYYEAHGLAMDGKYARATLLAEKIINQLHGSFMTQMGPNQWHVPSSIKEEPAFHGSPHDFEPEVEVRLPDGSIHTIPKAFLGKGIKKWEGAEVLKEHPHGRFSLQKIGTGEGNQSYGWGMYFSQSRDVAEHYKNRLSEEQPDTYKVNGKEVFLDEARQDPAERDTVQTNALRWLDLYSPSDMPLAESLVALEKEIQQHQEEFDSLSKNEVPSAWIHVGGKGPVFTPAEFRTYKRHAAAQLQHLKDSYKFLSSNKIERFPGKKGRLYSVELAPKEDEWLDWDEPIEFQPPIARRAIQELVERGSIEDEDQYLGSAAYHDIAETQGNQEDASKILRQLGVRGIRYATGATRHKEGKKEYNYVLFDDRDVEITAKEQPMQGGRYTPDDTSDIPEPDNSQFYLLNHALRAKKITPYFHEMLSNRHIPYDKKFASLRKNPKFAELSDRALKKVIHLEPDGLHLFAEALAPKIGNSPYRLVDTSWNIGAKELAESSKELEALAIELGSIFKDIQRELGAHLFGKYNPFANSEFAGFEIGDTSRFAYNRPEGHFADFKSRIYVNAHTTLAAIHALHMLNYVKGDTFSRAIATHMVETVYHELIHQTDPPNIGPKDAADMGLQGHNKEFDDRYYKTLETQAHRVIHYRDRLQKILEKDFERILSELGQQTLETDILGRVARTFSDKAVSYARRQRDANTDTVLAGLRGGKGSGLSSVITGLQESKPDYPLYKQLDPEQAIADSERRNLDAFMGEKSIFRKADGSYFPVYHGTTVDFDRFKLGEDIGIHFGETPESAIDRLRQTGALTAYNPETDLGRPLGRKEALLKKPLRKGELYDIEEGTQVLPVYLSIENPLRLPDAEAQGPEMILDSARKYNYISQEVFDEAMAEIDKRPNRAGAVARRVLEDAGYDGIQYTNDFEDPGSQAYLVFRAEQIKSALGNSGAFSPKSPNILRASDPVSLAIQSAYETGKLVYKVTQVFAEWAKRMAAKFGAGIKLHLEAIWEAVVKLHQDERGFVNPGKTFVSQDIAPTLKKTGVALAQSYDSIRRWFGPAGRGPDAKEMAGLLRQKNSEVWLKYFRAEAALHDARRLLDRMSTAERYDFIDRIEDNRPQANPDLQGIADVMRRLLDEARFSVQGLGTGKLQSFYVDYFPHIWKDPAAAQLHFSNFFTAKRPLAGKKSFLRPRTHIYFSDGIAAGLEPVSSNPVDLVLLKLHEVNKYVAGTEAMQELKASGMARFVRASKIDLMKHQGYAEINDNIATVYGMGPAATPQGGLLMRGKYMVPEKAAQVINNHLSPGLRQNAGFRYYMFTANLLNQLQLGWSMFHAGFTTIDAMVSKLSLANKYLAAGMPLKAAGQYLRANPITAPIENVIRGHRLLQESMRPGSQSPLYADTVQKLIAGGYRPRMEKIYTNDMAQKFKEAYRQGNPFGAALRAPFALTELIAKPVLEELVPRQKLGVAMDMVRFELERNPHMNQRELRQVIGKAWDSVDNRLGQMTYDNLFWNRAGKDVMMFTFRSVGWNLGTKREIGGGVADAGKMILDTLRGKKPELTHRTSYVISFIAYSALLGAITQYLYTGSGPEEPKDYFFPRTGNIDERGNPERVNLPTYMKDLYHYRDLYKLGPHSRKTFLSKTHPMLHMLGDLWQNEDYWGVEITNEDDSFFQRQLDRAKYVGKTSLPFGVQNFAKERERGASMAKSLVPILTGITPAPSDINQTPAEEELYKYNQENRSRGTRTKAEANRSQAMNSIRRDILTGKQDRAKATTSRSLAEGVITEENVRDVLSKLDKTPLQLRFSSTDAAEAVRIWDVMNAKEKEQVREMILKKATNILELPPAQRDPLIPKYTKVLQYYSAQGTPPK